MPRFNINQPYSPEADSTKGWEHPGTVVVAKTPNSCECGCLRVRTHRSRLFLPGHDAKLKGKLQRAQATGVPVEIVYLDDSGGEEIRRTRATAVATGKVHHWDRLIVESARRHIERLIGRTVPVKVGRWTKEGKIRKVDAEKSLVHVEVESAGGKKMVERTPFEIQQTRAAQEAE